MKSDTTFEGWSFQLTDREIPSVYLLLKEREAELDHTRLQLLDRLERELYRKLTIDEFEKIRDLYYGEG